MREDFLGPLPKNEWWATFSEEQCRDPMRALYDAEQEHARVSDLAKKACQNQKEWTLRIEELRKFIHQRIGPKP